jgi:hypothetical protein
MTVFGANRISWQSAARIVLMGTLIGVPAFFLVFGFGRNVVPVKSDILNWSSTVIGADFVVFYSAAYSVLHGDPAALYGFSELKRVQAIVAAGQVRDYSWAYPPTYLFFLVPFGLLPLAAAVWTWSIATSGAMAAAVYRLAPHPLSPVLAILFPANVINLMSGQNGALTAAILAAGLMLLPKRPIAAGLVLSLLVYKPHVTAIIPLALIVGGHYIAAAAMIAGVVVILGLSVAFFGFSTWEAFFSHGAEHFDYVVKYVIDGRLPSFRFFTTFIGVLRATHDVAIAWAAHAVVAVAALALCLFVWRRSTDGAWRALALVATMPLVSPYSFDYDQVVMAIPFAMLAWRSWQAGVRATDGIVLTLIWIMPIVAEIGTRWAGFPVGPVLLLILLAIAVRGALGGNSRARLDPTQVRAGTMPMGRRGHGSLGPPPR